MHWKSIYEKLKMGQLWSLYGVTLISAISLHFLNIFLSFLWISVFVDSNSKFKASFRDMILCQCKEFVDLTHHVIFDFFFVNFNNFPIKSLIKKTTILGLPSQFSSILNFRIISSSGPCGWNINQMVIKLWKIIT